MQVLVISWRTLGLYIIYMSRCIIIIVANYTCVSIHAHIYRYIYILEGRINSFLFSSCSYSCWNGIFIEWTMDQFWRPFIAPSLISLWALRRLVVVVIMPCSALYMHCVAYSTAPLVLLCPVLVNFLSWRKKNTFFFCKSLLHTQFFVWRIMKAYIQTKKSTVRTHLFFLYWDVQSATRS